jgi:hypothetical protein
VTPGATHAAATAASRSAHDRTVPVRVTMPSSLDTPSSSASSPAWRCYAAARALAAGDRSARTGVSAPGELGQLVFDHMATDLTRAEQTRRQLAADVAHGLRTPLAGLQRTSPRKQDLVFRLPTPSGPAAGPSRSAAAARPHGDQGPCRHPAPWPCHGSSAAPGVGHRQGLGGARSQDQTGRR